MTQQLSAGVVPEWTLGDRLRKARETVGLEAIQLADEIGVHRDTVANYEKGKVSRPRRIVLQAWALRTGVSLQWLQYGDHPVPEGGAPAGLSGEKSRTSDQKVRGSNPFGCTPLDNGVRSIGDRRRRPFVTLRPVPAVAIAS